MDVVKPFYILNAKAQRRKDAKFKFFVAFYRTTCPFE